MNKMNDLIKITLATAALIYGMTAPLPANEAVKETQESINKWYEQTTTSISKDITALGVTIQQLPENISLGVSNFWQETKQYQKDSWNETLKFEKEKQNWDAIKAWFAPKSEEVKK